VLAIVLITVSAVILLRPETGASGSQAGVPADVCQQKQDITFACYKHELEKIVDSQGPEQAFAMLRAPYNSVDYVKSQCHQLVHIVGRSAYLKYNNLGDTFTHGDQFCWSGYYHGALEELSKQKGEEAVKTANSVCADMRQRGDGSFDHFNCAHGLGHGFMFILGQDLFKALHACDSLTEYFERSSCYGGVFMQNIMNEQTPDKEEGYASPYLKQDQPMYPCTELEDKYKEQCYLMQTSHALQVLGYDFTKVFALCDATESKYRDTCYQSLGRDASGHSISDVDLTRATCLKGRDFEAQNQCVTGAAKDFVSYYHDNDKALQLCASLPNDLITNCQDTVNSYYSNF
jgi:hypothetical protein